MAGAVAWWKRAVVYQIYPRSFLDTNGDGLGDLPGVVARLEYLQALGVDTLWLCPFYPSPQVDNGYDIEDHQGVDPRFGTLADMLALLDAAHGRGMRVVVDAVLNHTSDAHPWFVASRSSRAHPMRNFYIWRDGPPHTPPNDWRSIFGGPAWTHDATTNAWYLHLFAREQPDLNWDNPEVRARLYGMLSTWLDRGVDGFRLDAISFISKKPGLPDMGATADITRSYANGPNIHAWLQEFHTRVLAGRDVMTVGEMGGVGPEEAPLYVGAARNELSMVIHFDHTALDRTPQDFFSPAPWQPAALREVFHRWDAALGEDGWQAVYLGNHDLPRLVSRFGDDGMFREQSARMLATLLLCWRGTPFIYQGDELGHPNTTFGGLEDFRDLVVERQWKEARARGVSLEEFLANMRKTARDHARTPMPWNAQPHGGFTSGTPWLPVHPGFSAFHAQGQRDNPDSVFHFYRRLIALRKATPVLVHGDVQRVESGNPDVWAFGRTWNNARALVVLNLGAVPAQVTLHAATMDLTGLSHTLGNEPPRGTLPTVELGPYGAGIWLA